MLSISLAVGVTICDSETVWGEYVLPFLSHSLSLYGMSWQSGDDSSHFWPDSTNTISLILLQLTWMQSTQLFLLPFCHLKLVGPFSSDLASKRHFDLENCRSLDILSGRFSVNPATFNVTEITFLLQQVVLTMFTWFNALIYCLVIGRLDNCVNLQLNRCTSKSDRREVRTCSCSICLF